MSRELTQKMRAFVEAYAGNGTEAAKLAGYEGNDDTLAVTASRLLSNAKIVQAIQERQEIALTGLIATREDIQAMWSMMANDPTLDAKDRMRASELLAKSHAMFIEKHEHTGQLTLEQLVAGTAEEKSES